MQTTIVTLSLVLAFAGPALPPADRTAQVEHCLVTILEQVQIPAREAGVLETLIAREGLVVTAGQELGTLDLDRAALEKKHAQFEWQIARKNSENDVNVRYAKAAWDVAKAEVARAEAANARVKDAVTRAELEERRLVATKSELQIEQSERDQEVAVVTAQTKQTLHELADVTLRRRRIVSPIAGVVVEVFKRGGEWVNPGDPVVRLVRMDRLRVEGFLNARKFGGELAGRPVTVHVELPGERREKFSGKIVFVSPEIEPVTDQIRVWAEVENRQLLLRPGAKATMEIHLEPPAAEAKERK